MRASKTAAGWRAIVLAGALVASIALAPTAAADAAATAAADAAATAPPPKTAAQPKPNQSPNPSPKPNPKPKPKPSGPMSCPDPDVTQPSPPVPPYRYYLMCTSDHAREAFPIRGSNDLQSWHFIGYLFPQGKFPWWAEPPPHGKFWAPSIYRIGNRWVVYFAAVLDQDRIHLPGPAGVYALAGGEMAIGVATATRLTGPWTTSVLHWRGQFNAITAEQEQYGGVIDPSMAVDPGTGRRYLFWAEQHYSIWVGRLSPDGLTLDPDIHQALDVQPTGWECSGRFCVVEGPTAFFHDGLCYLLYSGASTWNASYGVGAAVAIDPMQGAFARLTDAPILQSGTAWLGPGGTSDPVTAPDGRVEILYHASTKLNRHHYSALRYLRMGALTWAGAQSAYPAIGDGTAQ